MNILAWIVLGLIAGAIAKALMPGRDPGGLIVTILIGIVGSFLGGFLGNMIMGAQPSGFWWSLVLAVLGSMLLLWVYRLATGRRRTM
jgi:uncharacterized membrane protein YeaQ/YmgE (transglycosylase-associated protein family)